MISHHPLTPPWQFHVLRFYLKITAWCHLSAIDWRNRLVVYEGTTEMSNFVLLTHPCPDSTYPWVQLAWQGWHSLLASAYLKMKLLAPCRPSGHFSTQLGPSLKWRHFTQCSGPYGKLGGKKHCFFLWTFSSRVVLNKMYIVCLIISKTVTLKGTYLLIIILIIMKWWLVAWVTSSLPVSTLH